MNTIVLFYPRVPNYLQKVGQHTKNIAVKWWRRLQQLPLLCAKQQHNHCAEPDFPSLVRTMRVFQNTFIFILFSLSSSGEPRTSAQGSRHSHGTICIAPIILENLFLHGYIVSLKTPLFWATKGQLDLIKGKAKYKTHLSSRKKEAPHGDCSMAGECGVKTS